MTASSSPDLIDQLAGLAPGHPLDAIRARRAQARLHSQQSYLGLFEPAPPSASEFTQVERFAVAAFVAAWHRQAQATRFYAEGLARHGAPPRLRAVGLDTLAISDLIQGAAFFNWANRLMLSLGEPAVRD